jgi:hypothetical protein
MSSTSPRLTRWLNHDGRSDCDDLPPEVCRDVPANTLRHVGATTLQRIGDTGVDAKTVLPWVLATVGAPAGLTGLLVPLRESGSMLPQTWLLPRVRAMATRKWVWVAGAALQCLAVAGMAVAVAAASGAVAGWAIVGALAVFAFARSLSSLASKDVLGRTIPKGRRGRVNGWATMMAGVVAISVGLAMRVLGGDDLGAGAYAALLGVAALMWVAAGAVFARVTEPKADTAADPGDGALASARRLVREDAVFRRFVTARSLLLVSALSPPFVVLLAAEQTAASFSQLGLFVVGSGIASILGGRIFGGMADRSSRAAMMIGAGASTVVIVAVLGLRAVPAIGEATWLFLGAYLLLTLAHTGARVGRKTYVVDIATGDARTEYVAVSNTLMGLVLLAAGGGSALLAQLGVEVALLFLAALGALGVVVSRSLPEVR